MREAGAQAGAFAFAFAGAGTSGAGGTRVLRVCRLLPMNRRLGFALILSGIVAWPGCGRDAGPASRALPADTVAMGTVQESVAMPASAATGTDSVRPARAEVPRTAERDSSRAAEAVVVTPGEPQDSALTLLRRTAARYGSIRSLRAMFSMETSNPLLRETVKSRGELFQRRPDRLLMRFTEPAGDVIVSDGQFIWIWYPSIDSTQVMRSPAGSGGGAVDLLAQFVGDPTKRFSWSVGRTETIAGHTATMYTLDPLREEAYQQLVVWIDRDDALVRRFEVTEASGVSRRIELRDVVIDSDLPDSIFRFTPPPGARIVGAP